MDHFLAVSEGSCFHSLWGRSKARKSGILQLRDINHEKKFVKNVENANSARVTISNEFCRKSVLRRNKTYLRFDALLLIQFFHLLCSLLRQTLFQLPSLAQFVQRQTVAKINHSDETTARINSLGGRADGIS